MLKRKHAWGIEIGTTSLKAIRLSIRDGQPQVSEWSVIDYPAHEGTEESQILAVQTAMQELLQKHKLRASDAIAVAVPGRAVFSKFIKLPPVEKKRIPEIVKYESRQQIPFPIDDVVWDYQPVLEETPAGEEVEVGIFAVRREIVQEKLGMLYSMGLRPEIVQGANLALFNYLSFDRKIDGAVIAIDMGAEASDLAILHADRFWIRNLPTGGSAVTKALQARLQLPFKDAEKLKCEAGASKQAEKLAGMMKPSLAGFLREVQLSLGFYKSQREDVRFTRCMVSGRGFLLKGLTETLAAGLHVPLERIGPPQTIGFADAPEAESFKRSADRLGAAMGLALQGLGLGRLRLNLIPSEILKARQAAQKKPYAVAASLLVFIAVLFLYVRVVSVGEQAMAQEGEADKQLKKLVTNQGDFQRSRDGDLSFRRVEELEQRLRREILVHPITHMDHGAYLRALSETLRVLPSLEVWIESFNVELVDHPRAALPDFPPALPRKLMYVTLSAHINAFKDAGKAVDVESLKLAETKVLTKGLETVPAFDCSANDPLSKFKKQGILTDDDIAKLTEKLKRGGSRIVGVSQAQGSFPDAQDYFHLQAQWFVLPPQKE